jgi:hypothetical protein
MSDPNITVDVTADSGQASDTLQAAAALIPRPVRVIVADDQNNVLDSWDVTQEGADLGPTRNARAAILTVSAAIR